MTKQCSEAGTPEKIKIYHHGDDKEIVLTNRLRWSLLFLIPWAVFWNVGIVFNFIIVLPYIGSIPLLGALFIVLCLIAMLWIGVNTSYMVVTMLFNKIYIYVDPMKITVRHRPISWRENRDIQISDIKRLYVESHFSSKISVDDYAVRILSHDWECITLIAGLKKGEEARFIEGTIRSYLT